MSQHRRRSAAAFLTANGYQIDHDTLTKLANSSEGPPFDYIGKTEKSEGVPLYSESNLLAWAKAQGAARGK